MSELRVDLVSSVSIQDFVAWLRQQEDFTLSVYCDVYMHKKIAIMLCPEDINSLSLFLKKDAGEK